MSATSTNRFHCQASKMQFCIDNEEISDNIYILTNVILPFIFSNLSLIGNCNVNVSLEPQFLVIGIKLPAHGDNRSSEKFISCNCFSNMNSQINWKCDNSL